MELGQAEACPDWAELALATTARVASFQELAGARQSQQRAVRAVWCLRRAASKAAPEAQVSEGSPQVVQAARAVPTRPWAEQEDSSRMPAESLVPGARGLADPAEARLVERGEEQVSAGLAESRPAGPAESRPAARADWTAERIPQRFRAARQHLNAEPVS